MRVAGFSTLTEALDCAATSDNGLNFYSGRARLIEKLPYRELRCQAMSLARKLLGLGLGRHDSVGLVAETSANFARIFFACQYAGLVPVPLPLPPPFGEKSAYIENVRRMLARARAAAALGPSAYVGMIRQAAEPLALKVLGTFSDLEGSPEKEVALPSIRPDDPSFIQFSSGSTRSPTGIVVTQRGLLANLRGITDDALKLRPSDRSVSWLPFYHDMGLVGFLLAPVAGQVSVDYVPTREFAVRPLIWPTLISQNGGTISYGPSFGYDLCACRGAKTFLAGLDLSTWRVAGIGGEMIRADALARFTQVFQGHGFRKEAFLASYGMSEATLGVSFAPLGRGIEVDTVDLELLQRADRAIPVADDGHAHQVRRFVLCGRVLPNLDLEIRGADGSPLKDREVGRIMVRGPSVVHRYFADGEETARAFSDDGWLDTGDTGYLAKGSLVVTGRTKDLIVINGRNVWPQDLEWAVERQVDGVSEGDVAAFSVDEGEEERAVVLVECRKSDIASRNALARAASAAILATAGIRCIVVSVPRNSLPKTSSGKLARSRARRMYVEGLFQKSPVGSPMARLRASGNAFR